MIMEKENKNEVKKMEEKKLTSWGDWFAKNFPVLVEVFTDIYKVLKYKREHAEDDEEESKKALKDALNGD